MFKLIHKNFLLLLLLILNFSLFNAEHVFSKENSIIYSNTLSPEKTVKDFYVKYLNMWKNHISSMDEGKPTLKMYVSKKLMGKLEKLNELEYGGEYPNIPFLHELDFNGSLDADYFLKSQDYFDDWITNISVTPAEISNGIATTIVTLGATDRSRHTLRVNLKRELGLWKITAVFKIDPS